MLKEQIESIQNFKSGNDHIRIWTPSFMKCIHSFIHSSVWRIFQAHSVLTQCQFRMWFLWYILLSRRGRWMRGCLGDDYRTERFRSGGETLRKGTRSRKQTQKAICRVGRRFEAFDKFVSDRTPRYKLSTVFAERSCLFGRVCTALHGVSGTRRGWKGLWEM